MVLKKMKVSNKMNKAIIYVLGFFIIALSISCVEVDLVDKPNTKVSLILPPLEEGGVESYTVEINGQKMTIGADGYLPELYPGVYPMLVYSNSPSITVNNGIAQVNLLNGQLNGFPDLFFSKSTEIRLENNVFDNKAIDLEAQVRLLEMIITPPSGGIYDHVSSIEGKVTGVSGRWDLINNVVVGPAMEVPVKFVKQDNGTWLAKLRLLGVFGNKQELIGEILFSNQSSQLRIKASSLKANQGEQSLLLQSDLSDYFKTFNTGKSVPFSLGGAIDLPTESGFVVSINEWQRLNETGIAW